MVHWRGTTTREADDKARALHIAKDAELATKTGCPHFENAETDRRRQSDRLSQNHRTAGKTDGQAQADREATDSFGGRTDRTRKGVIAYDVGID